MILLDKDNKIRTNFYIKKENNLSTIKYLELKIPELIKYFLEQEITNDLGYCPVRETMHENKKHTKEGLMKHLANMDYLILFKEMYNQRIFACEHGQALISLENHFKDFINKERDFCKKANRELDKINALL